MDSPQYRRKRPKFEPRVMLDYFMGLLWMLVAVFVGFSKELFHSDFFEDHDFVQGGMKWFLMGVFMLYGVFRIYRGYQLQKENDEEM